MLESRWYVPIGSRGRIPTEVPVSGVDVAAIGELPDNEGCKIAGKGSMGNDSGACNTGVLCTAGAPFNASCERVECRM